MSTPLFVVDAFAHREFTGNPAGVCLLRRPAPRSWMQRVAAEMKHAETAFVSPVPGGFRLRWFTPTVEVDLCGHATLASAHVLWSAGVLPARSPGRFFTQSGPLTAVRRPPFIMLDFPSEPCEEVDAPPALEAAIDRPYRFVGQNRHDYLVELDSPRRLRELRPEMDRLTQVGGRGVIVTSRSDRRGVDFLCRFFAPAAGVPEDPATGSIQCALAPYWSAKLGKERVTSLQASPRGGALAAEPAGDRVRIFGRAITVLACRLSSDPVR